MKKWLLATLLLSVLAWSQSGPLNDQNTNVWGASLNGVPSAASGSAQNFPDIRGTITNQFEIVVSGTAPATLTTTVVGCMRGGTCSSTLASSAGTASQIVTPSSANLNVFDFYKVTLSWTGGDATTRFVVNRTGTTARLGGGAGSGTVSANNGTAGAIANYAAAGGSTTVGPDATLTDDGTTLKYLGTALQTPQGACASTPALKFGATGAAGFAQGGTTTQIALTDGTLCRFLFVTGAAMTQRMGGAGILAWTSTAGDASGTIDTTLSRGLANHVQAGSTTNNSNGGMDAAGFFSKGTTFTGNAGCSETTLVGGATAGKFTAVSTSCTIIITMGNSMTAPTGWDCNIQDLTTAADAHNPRESASTTTTVTFITGTIVSSDVLSFSCIGY